MIDWWRILLDPDDEQYDDKFFDELDNEIDFCDKILEKDPKNIDALFFKGGSIGFSGRLSVMRESWLSAASAGREALPIVEEAALSILKMLMSSSDLAFIIIMLL